MKLSDIATRLGCRLVGNADLEIEAVSTVEQAGPNELTFLSNPKYAPKARKTKAGPMLVQEPIAGLEISYLISANP